MTSQFNIAILGATGLVGQELISILTERRFPVKQLRLLASSNSAGEKIEFRDQEITVQELGPEALRNMDIAFFAIDGSIAKQAHAWAQESGTICIDKSSAFRLDPEVPLVIPEVNPQDIAHYTRKGLIACPNCTSTPLVQMLAPLHREAGLKRVVVCSYQAVSGAGKAGIDELERETLNLFNLKDPEPKHFAHRIAFNVLPYIADEEEKMVAETRRILNLPDLAISATCARVPIFNGHSAAIHMEFERHLAPEMAREILAVSPGIRIMDDITKNLYPTPFEASGKDDTYVGRIRTDPSVKHGLAAWYSSDNLRTGAALNAVKIAEVLSRKYLQKTSK